MARIRPTDSDLQTLLGPDVGRIFSSGFRAFDIFAGMTAPIFHGGTLKARQRGAEAAMRAAAATYQETVVGAFGQVADLLNALRNDARSVETQQQAADVAIARLYVATAGGWTGPDSP